MATIADETAILKRHIKAQSKALKTVRKERDRAAIALENRPTDPEHYFTLYRRLLWWTEKAKRVQSEFEYRKAQAEVEKLRVQIGPAMAELPGVWEYIWYMAPDLNPDGSERIKDEVEGIENDRLEKYLNKV